MVLFNRDVAEKTGLPIILWSIDTLDWQNRNHDVIFNTVLDQVNDGDIVLMHDLYKSTAEAVRRIIPALKRKGYQLVTVSELARVRGIPLKPGNVYSNLYPIQS